METRKNNLIIYTKILFGFVISVYLSRFFVNNIYALRPGIPTHYVILFVIKFIGLAIVGCVCVLGYRNVNKNENFTKVCLAAIGVIALFELYSAVRSIIDLSYNIQNVKLGQIIINDILGNLQNIMLLALIIILMIAYYNKKEAKQKETANDKSGMGGFFIIPLIRNIAMPLTYISASIISVLIFFRADVPRGIYSQYFYASSILFTIILLVVLSIMTVIKMFGRRKSFIPFAISIEIISIFTNSVKIASCVRTDYFETLGVDIALIIISALFIVYYAKSIRIKNTFIEQ